MHNGRKSFKCLDCLKSFQNKKRRKILIRKIWKLFADKKQVVKDVSENVGYSSRSVYRILDEKDYSVIPEDHLASYIMVIMDCVYFRRVCVYLVIRNWYKKKNIYLKRIPYETIRDYVLAIDDLENKGYIIDGIVVDGRKGLFEALSPSYPIQMCQFHQKQIVRRYLTNNSQTAAGVELKEIIEELTLVDQQWFEILSLSVNMCV